MHIIFYRSILCPRCHMTDRYLKEIALEDPTITIERREIMRNPLTAWNDCIRIVPAVRIGENTLSGLYVGRRRIRHFINSCRQAS